MEEHEMSSTTGAHPHVAGLIRTPDWSVPARLRMAAAVTTSVVGRSLAAARAYEGAHSTSERRAVLRDLAGSR
jgi:hypothetical protein